MILEYKSYKKQNLTPPSQLVAMFHGYGSNQNDLITLAPELSIYIPDALFISFNAPFSFEGDLNASGRQWFSLLDRSREAIASGLQNVEKIVATSINNLLLEHNLTQKELCLLGFSQGTMLSLHMAASQIIDPHLILGYSGRIIPNHYPNYTGTNKIFLLHGSEDSIITTKEMLQSEEFLQKRGFNVQHHISRHLAHGIDHEGINQGGQFLKENFRK